MATIWQLYRLIPLFIRASAIGSWVQFLSTAPNKRAPLAGAFLFGMFLSIRQELRVGAVLREQNALPRDICTANYSMAKPDVSNVGAGRAAKGVDGCNFFNEN